MGVRVAAWVLLLSILCMDIRVHARLRGRSAAVEPEVPDSVESDVHPLEKNEVKIPEQETPPKVVEPPKVPATPRQEVNRQALVVGGNGFIGSAVVEKLLLEGYQVTILNRNSTYFDIRERIITRVGHVLWDRSRPLRECTPLEEYFVKHPVVHAVVDLSCYDAQAARELGTYISRFKVNWYIYVSTDSVYEVCEKTHQGLTKEEDAVRPKDEALSKALQAADDYGHKKLEAEEELVRLKRSLEADGQVWQYAFVRIPDVMGPRDTTYRWWLYQTLVKLQPELDVPIPFVKEDEKGRKLSLVYVGDVAKAVAWIISDQNTQIRDTAVNIAGYEQITFMDMIQSFADALGVKQPLHYALNATTDLPSVKQGPVDLSKARKLMGWQSTPWQQVVKEGVPWYEAAMRDARYAKERDTVLTMVYQQVARYGKQKELQVALKKVYGVTGTIVDRLLLEAPPSVEAPVQAASLPPPAELVVEAVANSSSGQDKGGGEPSSPNATGAASDAKEGGAPEGPSQEGQGANDKETPPPVACSTDKGAAGNSSVSTPGAEPSHGSELHGNSTSNATAEASKATPVPASAASNVSSDCPKSEQRNASGAGEIGVNATVDKVEATAVLAPGATNATAVSANLTASIEQFAEEL